MIDKGKYTSFMVIVALVNVSGEMYNIHIYRNIVSYTSLM